MFIPRTETIGEYLKNKLKTSPQLVGNSTNQLKLKAAGGKTYTTDVLDAAGIVRLAKFMLTTRQPVSSNGSQMENTIDGRARRKHVKPCSAPCLTVLRSVQLGGFSRFMHICSVDYMISRDRFGR